MAIDTNTLILLKKIVQLLVEIRDRLPKPTAPQGGKKP